MKYLIACLFLCSCDISKTILPDDEIYVSSFMGNEKIQDISNAIDEWRKVDDSINIKLVLVNNPYAYDGTIIEEKSLSFNEDGDIVFGKTERTLNYVNIGIDFQRIYNHQKENPKSSVTAQEVITHELGHGFGLNHNDSGIMHKSTLGEKCIDQLTVDQYCEIYDCVSPKSTCLD